MIFCCSFKIKSFTTASHSNYHDFGLSTSSMPLHCNKWCHYRHTYTYMKIYCNCTPNYTLIHCKKKLKCIVSVIAGCVFSILHIHCKNDLNANYTDYYFNPGVIPACLVCSLLLNEEVEGATCFLSVVAESDDFGMNMSLLFARVHEIDAGYVPRAIQATLRCRMTDFYGETQILHLFFFAEENWYKITWKSHVLLCMMLDFEMFSLFFILVVDRRRIIDQDDICQHFIDWPVLSTGIVEVAY